MTYQELWELTQNPFIHVEDPIKVTLTSGQVKTGYFADLEYESDNDVADGLRLEKNAKFEKWGGGILIPAKDIQSIDVLVK